MAVMQRAVRKVMRRELSDVPLHIVFDLFDENKDGNLAASELLTVSRPFSFIHFCSILRSLPSHNALAFQVCPIQHTLHMQQLWPSSLLVLLRVVTWFGWSHNCDGSVYTC